MGNGKSQDNKSVKQILKKKRKRNEKQKREY